MKDTYKALNMGKLGLNLDYEPEKSDVSSLLGVLDHNGDGKITLEDLEKLATKYLCGDDILLGNLRIGSAEDS